MRLWSLHPKYLDKNGLVALWREGLLAKAVLEGKTEGYRHHPQLLRFRRHPAPVDAINAYLEHVLLEGIRRGYRFDASRIARPRLVSQIPVTEGQVRYEWNHLLGKLQRRSPDLYSKWQAIEFPDVNPVMYVIPGDVEDWEIRRREPSLN